MQPPSERAAAGRTPLAAALLDYRHHPGRYSIARREPAILFASIREVLQLAAGKSAHDEHGALQAAAAFFVRSALIHPGADHYTLLGVGRASDEATIKAHYRLMMRLVHPDFSAATGAAWPSDAATRLNRAYEVLGTPDKRARYDEELFGPAAAPRPAPVTRPHAVPPRTPAGTEPRVLVKWLAGGFGALGALGVVGLLVAGGGDRESLIRGTPTFRTAVLPLLVDTPSVDPLPVATDEAATPPARIDGPQPAPAPAPTAAPLAPLAPRIAAASIPPAAVPAEPVPAQPAPPAAPAAASPLAVAPPAIASALPAPVAAAVKPNPGVTLAQAQPLLAALIQQLESGRGDRVLSLLERDARNAPAARALSRQLDGLVDGARPVTLSTVEFRAEPAEGRLFVTGHIRFHAGDAGAAVKRLGLRVEFMSRDGAVVMTGLSGLGDN